MSAPTVECGFCGTDFVEDRSQPACAACPLSRGCHFVRCPRCGYENPAPLGRSPRGSSGGRAGGVDDEGDLPFLHRCVKWWRSP